MSNQSESQRRASDRRATNERRTGSERRRNADIRTPIIHITPALLHVLIHVDRGADQPSLAIYRTLPWREQSTSLHSPEGQRELTAALTRLATEERLAGDGAVLLLGSHLCVTRAVTGVSEEVQRETAQLRERSQLYLSLGPGKKVIASSSTPLDARHAHALLTVATEQTLEVLSQAVDSAGMELAAIRSAQVSLARAVQHARGDQAGATLVIGVDDGEVELGVMSCGRLFLDYLPGGDTDLEQLGSLLSQHHTRLRRYCQRHHGLEGEQLTQVVISGSPQQAQLARQQVRSIESLDVSLLEIEADSLEWETRGDPPTPEHAAVVGAVMQLADNPEQRGPDLVEHLKSTARPPVVRMLLRKLSPMAAALLVAAGMSLLNWSTARSVTHMKEDLAVLTPQADRASHLREELLAGTAEIEQLDRLAQSISSQPYSLMLKNMTRSMPGEVWLSALRIVSDETATLAGSSYTESSIYDLVGNLQNLPGVGQVALEGTGIGRKGNRTATTFDILMDFDFNGRENSTEEGL